MSAETCSKFGKIHQNNVVELLSWLIVLDRYLITALYPHKIVKHTQTICWQSPKSDPFFQTSFQVWQPIPSISLSPRFWKIKTETIIVLTIYWIPRDFLEKIEHRYFHMSIFWRCFRLLSFVLCLSPRLRLNLMTLKELQKLKALNDTIVPW